MVKGHHNIKKIFKVCDNLKNMLWVIILIVNILILNH